MLLAGVNTTEQFLGGVDPSNITAYVARVPDETQLQFAIRYKSLCSAAPDTTMAAIPLADVQFETYTVYFYTGRSRATSAAHTTHTPRHVHRVTHTCSRPCSCKSAIATAACHCVVS